MGGRSTRNKIRWQGDAALVDLINAQEHLVNIAVKGDDHSLYINDHLPPIIAGMEVIIDALKDFNEGL
jgi:hypothetical protein